MKKTYLVKRDPERSGSDNWIIMNSHDFYQFLQTPEGKSRRANFGRIDQSSPDDAVIYIETTKEKVRELERERSFKRHKQHLFTKYYLGSVSLDELFDGTDEETCALQLLDPNCNLEEAVIYKSDLTNLYRALQKLEPHEREFIYRYYSQDCPSITSYSLENGMSRRKCDYRIAIILDKLRRLMADDYSTSSNAPGSDSPA